MISVILALLWVHMANAVRHISTSALLPCMESTEFSAHKFDVTFFPDDEKATIDVDIQSAIDGNFTADLTAYVYGIEVFTKSLSGCDISKTICPISPGRFSVEHNLTIPSNIISEIPGIAYTFPNIDAVVQAKIYYVDSDGNKKSNTPVACVVSQLSNGKTVQHNYVGWILFGIIMVGVIVSAVSTIYGDINTASHIMSSTLSLFTYFQAMAIASLMALYRMPPIAAAWTQNFMWTLGIMSVGFMQTAVSWYIRSTGGTETVILDNTDELSVAVYKKRSLSEQLYSMIPEYFNPSKSAGTASKLAKRFYIDTKTNVTTTDEKDDGLLGKTLILQGVKRAAFLADVEITHLFMTAVAFFIFIGIFLVIALMLLKGILELSARTNNANAEKFKDYRENYHGYTKASLFRYFYVGFAMLSFFCLWEFTDRASAATVVVACVMFIVTILALVMAATKVIILGYKSKSMFQNPASILFGNYEVFNRWGYLYMQYNSHSYWFVIPALVYLFAKSAVIALGQSNGKAQSIVFLIIEVLFFILLCVVRPYLNKATNGYNIALCVFSIVNAVFYMFFAQLFGEKVDVASSIMGIVYFIMNAIVCFVYLIILVVNCLFAIFHPHPDARYQPVTDDRNMFMPTSGHEKNDTELDDLGIAAQDGYRHTYRDHEPSAADHLGAVRMDPNDPYDDLYHDAPQHAMRDRSNTFGDDFESYRDTQSRGVALGEKNYEPHRADDRLI